MSINRRIFLLAGFVFLLLSGIAAVMEIVLLILPFTPYCNPEQFMACWGVPYLAIFLLATSAVFFVIGIASLNSLRPAP